MPSMFKHLNGGAENVRRHLLILLFQIFSAHLIPSAAHQQERNPYLSQGFVE